MASSERRFALRDATTDAHAALDRLVGDFADTAAYARYLRGMHAFRAPVEAVFRDSGVPPIAPLIATDLADMGLPPLPLRNILLASGPSAHAGIAYVLAGSALGARLLLARARALGWEPRHLVAQTADRGAWPAFCAELEAIPNYDADTAADAACATFSFANLAFADAAEHAAKAVGVTNA